MQITIEELLELTGGKLVRGEAGCVFTGLAALNEATSCEVSFLGNEKYYSDYLVSKAGAILVPLIVEKYPEGVCVVEVEKPSSAFSEVVKFFSNQQRKFVPGVHATAVVADDVVFDPEKVSIKAGAVIESGVEIGDGTEIGANVVIYDQVKIGADCTVHANVIVREFCELGDRVNLQPGCVIGADGYGYEFVDGCHKSIDQVGIVELADDVDIGANTTIDRARFGKTIVGKGTKIDNLVQLGHNVRVGNHSLIVAQSGVAGSTHIGDYVTIAAQVGIAGHLKIDDKAMVTALSGVTKNLPGGVTYSGFPAQPYMAEKRFKAKMRSVPNLIDKIKDLEKQVKALKDGLGDNMVSDA